MPHKLQLFQLHYEISKQYLLKNKYLLPFKKQTSKQTMKNKTKQNKNPKHWPFCYQPF